nr:MAG TPA: Thrombomodulin like fifth domain, EGF-like [Caudoviricetes sp.]
MGESPKCRCPEYYILFVTKMVDWSRSPEQGCVNRLSAQPLQRRKPRVKK